MGTSVVGYSGTGEAQLCFQLCLPLGHHGKKQGRLSLTVERARVVQSSSRGTGAEDTGYLCHLCIKSTPLSLRV